MTALQTADRVLDTLFLLSDHGPLSPREIAEKLGVSRATAYNLLQSLESHHLAVPAGPQKFRLGPAVYRFSSSASGYLDLLTAARPRMERLRNFTTETVILHVRVGHERVSIERFESLHQLRSVGTVGDRRPLNTGGAGFCLLAWESEETISRFLMSGDVRAMSPKSLTDPDLIRKELAATRARGYALRRDDVTAGLSVLSVPIRKREGGARASLSVPWPTARWSDEHALGWLPAMNAAASEIAEALA